MMDEGIELSKLTSTLSGMSQGATVVLRTGLFHWDGIEWTVNSGGNTVAATWLSNIIPYESAPCMLLLATTGGANQYFVIGLTNDQPTPGCIALVQSFTAGQPTFAATIYGQPITVWRASNYTPVAGDQALVEYKCGQWFGICALAVYASPPPPEHIVPPVATPPAAQPVITGTSHFNAQDSGTWTAAYGGWNSYYGQNVFSGSGYVPVSTGAWFYNGAVKSLASKTLTTVRFYIGPRKQAGSYNSIITAHFYAHNRVSRGSSEPTRIAGPFDVPVPAHYGGGWATLPSSFAAALKAGGGISIAGDPYIGFAAGPESPQSGTLSIDWSN